MVIELSKLKKHNPKIKIKKLDGSRPKKKMFRIPVNGFIEIADPYYELDELPVDAVFELKG